MKRLLTILGIACAAININAQSYSVTGTNSHDLNAPVGWGNGITGANGATEVTVTNMTQLRQQAGTSGARTIYIKGDTINITSMLTVKSNKTIIGLPGAVLRNPNRESGQGIFKITGNNVIIRNITFLGAGAYDVDGNDNITVSGGTNVWIDHCDIQDGVDDNLDIVNGADNVCITWCRFRYLIAPLAGGSGGSSDHRNCNLIGGSDKNISTDGDKLRVTFANCWWDEGCHERMPRVRFGKVHVANSLFSTSVANYCIGAGYRSNIYAESNAFTSAKAKNKPWANYATSSVYTDYNITMTNNVGASNVQTKSGSIEYFIPSTDASYTTFDIYDAADVEATVTNSKNGAGATLQVVEASGISSTTAKDVVKREYYTLDGVQIQSPKNGVNIVKTIYSDGSAENSKINICQSK